MFDVCFHGLPGTLESAVYSLWRGIQQFRNRSITQLVTILQVHQLASINWQTPNGLPNEIDVRVLLTYLFRDISVTQTFRFASLAEYASGLVTTNGRQPRPKAAWTLQAVESSASLCESLLCRIFAKVAITQNSTRNRHHCGVIPLAQREEAVHVSAHRGQYEFFIWVACQPISFPDVGRFCHGSTI